MTNFIPNPCISLLFSLIFYYYIILSFCVVWFFGLFKQAFVCRISLLYFWSSLIFQVCGELEEALLNISNINPFHVMLTAKMNSNFAIDLALLCI